MSRPLLMSAAAALAFTASQALAAPVINFPPPGSHSFVALYETSAPLEVCQHVQCQIVSDPSVNTSMAQTTFFGSNPIEFITGSGTTGPNAMHAFLTANVFAEVDTAFDDTYTVHGGTAPFSITVTMNAHGTANTIPFGPGNIAIGSLTGIIGAFDIDPTHLLPTVDPFAQATSNLIDLVGAPQTAQANLSVSYTRIVNPGDVFDLAYELETDIIGNMDANHTANISFTLPDGVFLTAASGATFGDVPTTGGGVPEPASWALMIAGFGLAGSALRRRRSAAA